MKLSVEGRLRIAVRCAFAVGALGTASPAIMAQDSVEQLQGVEVTGTHIRRVDSATADTVQVLDRKQIQATGAVTLGQLVQSVPAISGTITNSVANNDPSAGADPFGNSDVNLRGLGAVRTLVLLDGHRINYPDVAGIPTNMIERVEILKEGASAVYGTDAIGGVVNFITRKHFHGLDASAQFGETQYGDAQTSDFNLTYGANAPGGGNVMFGMDYNRQSGVEASDRTYSAYPWGYAYGRLSKMGAASAIPPSGLFFLPYGAIPGEKEHKCQHNNNFGLVGSTYGAWTLAPGGDPASTDGYECYKDNVTGVGPTSRFNYQPYNLDLDPSQRVSLFGNAEIPITDNIRWFGQGYFTDTKASFTLAPSPFTAGQVGGIFNTTAPVIPQGGTAGNGSNVFNPFNTPVTSFYKRATAAGPRHDDGTSDAVQVTTGFRGTLLDRYDWSAFGNYGVLTQTQSESGILDFSNIYAELGPNFINSNGQVQCGTTANPLPLSTCTPINVFALGGGPNSLAADSITAVSTFRQTTVEFGGDINGDLFTIPWAGAVGFAAGVDFRDVGLVDNPDSVFQLYHADEQNDKATQGSYSVREIYGETHVPLVKNLPLIKSLSLDLGVRSAWYSTAQLGSTVDGKYAFEYRPYSDLLLRGSYNDVYRAPNVSELYGGAQQSAPGYTDPCNGTNAQGQFVDKNGNPTGDTLANHPIACKNVQGGFKQANPQGTAEVVGNPALTPEKGYATDFGAVFNPSFYKPLTLEVDYWRYSMKQLISGVSLNQILDACFADGTSEFCGTSPTGQAWFSRDNHGQISNAQELLLNSDRLYTSGIDFSAKLNYPKVQFASTPLGSVQLGIDVTYLDQWDYTAFDPATGAFAASDNIAGQVETQGLSPAAYAATPRFKGLGFVFWSYGSWTTSVEDRYFGSVSDMVGQNAAGVPYYAGVGYANYVDVAETYKWAKIHSEFTVGINDIADEGIQPLFDTAHAGAPATAYDPRGRNFYGRVTVHFK